MPQGLKLELMIEDESEGSDSECNGVLDLSRFKMAETHGNEALDSLFNVFCECSELNPEPFEENEEEEHNWIFSAEQLENEAAGEVSEPSIAIGQSNGDHDLARTVLEIQINDQRFEDAEEMEQETDGAWR